MAAPLRVQALGSVPASSTGTLLTAHASANTKGAWVALGTLDIDAISLILRVGVNSGAIDALIDLAVGQSSDEQIVQPNILYTTPAVGCEVSAFRLPHLLTRGLPVWARMQANTGGASLRTVAYAVAGPVAYGLPRHATWGADTSDSGGTSYDPGTSAHPNLGPWVQMVSAAPFHVKALALGIGNGGDYARSTATWHWRFGVGPANDEIQIAELDASVDQIRDAPVPGFLGWFSVNIPKGSRLSVASSCSITGADRVVDVVLYGAGV